MANFLKNKETEVHTHTLLWVRIALLLEPHMNYTS